MSKLFDIKSNDFISFSPIKEPALFFSKERFVLEDEIVSSVESQCFLKLIKNNAELLKLLRIKAVTESELVELYDEFKALCIRFVNEVNKSKSSKNEKIRLVMPSCKEFLTQ